MHAGLIGGLITCKPDVQGSKSPPTQSFPLSAVHLESRRERCEEGASWGDVEGAVPVPSRVIHL